MVKDEYLVNETPFKRAKSYDFDTVLNFAQDPVPDQVNCCLHESQVRRAPESSDACLEPPLGANVISRDIVIYLRPDFPNDRCHSIPSTSTLGLPKPATSPTPLMRTARTPLPHPPPHSPSHPPTHPPPPPPRRRRRPTAPRPPPRAFLSSSRRWRWRGPRCAGTPRAGGTRCAIRTRISKAYK